MIFRRNNNKSKVKFFECSRLVPEVFNDSGEKMHVWYLADSCTYHTPYSLNAAFFPEKVLWDRYNTSLPIRFFAHESIFDNHEDEFEHDDYALLYESEAIIPEIYNKLLNNKEIGRKYKYIFTPSARIIEEFENARFIPANGFWYGSDFQGGELEEDKYKRKTKNISIVASSKCLCEGHKIRLRIAKELQKNSMVDAYGSFGGIDLPKKAQSLDDYRYSVVVENDFTPFYFTEKILDCFAAQTVPIYLGAERIGDYFNIDGIITVDKNNINEIGKILNMCTEEDYLRRKEAILDNYNRVMKYRCIEDYIYDNYFD
ncbi:Glycosyltransferase family 10 (fucosyltransferase) C-term [Pseudobutyrivibrio ruminis]|uniref:Glycosyltransferase family 10 (Fucosyltransferase) C-term n=1 Tax=Pseudobutyrivibrio ruminis TaxID=46206 RepID=A0A1H7H614_9FIRM|nr:glycosyltransferase family 10 [Pseudobutyrivibrio ruminis]SEK45678.1 Glycosyltransferase family 10 (fucosyltransferase) C-term [Pseudobutyrivibrio ruminis]